MEASKKTLSVISDLLKSYPSNPIQQPELNPELDQMTKNLEKIIAFVNPKSGKSRMKKYDF